MSKTFLFVSAQYLPTAGGVERYTQALACRLIAQGHRVIVVTSELKGLASHETGSDGVEIIRLPSFPFMNGRLPLLRPDRDFRKLEALIWDRRIDHCVINTYFYPLSMYAASQVFRRKIPALIINHGSAWLMTGNPVLQLAGKLYEHTAARLCRHYCSRFFGVSAAARDWMKTFSIQAEGIITNAIDPEDVQAQADSGWDWRKALGIPAESKLIAFAGRLIPEKGVLPLIDAMEAIRKVHPDAVLAIAGDGPLMETCRAKNRESVHMLGVQPYARVLALFQQADLFCLPSRSEGFACTVLEAAAMGCPILTTATGGSPQLLITEAHGKLLENMSEGAISAACIAALNDPDWRTTASRLAYDQLVGHFTWDAAVAQLYDAFEIQSI